MTAMPPQRPNKQEITQDEVDRTEAVASWLLITGLVVALLGSALCILLFVFAFILAMSAWMAERKFLDGDK